jgi:cytochrome oxidase assembly protein ShyY1
MKKISNPLTIIGMFAGIAEVSGTVVLPFIDRSLQYLFIWYVMGFPVFLVAVFFLTMNYNPNVR